jgi:hypothetical protein
VRDSILAIADASYFDWPVLPEAPSGLRAEASGSGVRLRWELHGGDASKVAVERRVGTGQWQRVATQSAGTEFSDNDVARGSVVSYRIRALNGAGESAYSNVARLNR